MDDKANILHPGQTVIDLGASPGSWTQVAVQKTNSDGADATQPIGTVLSVDKLQIFPIEVMKQFFIYFNTAICLELFYLLYLFHCTVTLSSYLN